MAGSLFNKVEQNQLGLLGYPAKHLANGAGGAVGDYCRGKNFSSISSRQQNKLSSYFNFIFKAPEFSSTM